MGSKAGSGAVPVKVLKIGGSCLDDRGSLDHAARIVARSGAGTVAVISALKGVTDAILGAAARPGSEDAFVASLCSRHEACLAALPPRHQDPARRALAARSVALLGDLRRGDADAAAAAGEDLAVITLRAFVAAEGVRARALSGPAAGIRAAGPVGLGRILPESAARVQRAIDPAGVALVAGFAGLTPEGAIRTLGRGGSDLTAAFIARSFGVGATLLKDTPGILDLAPRLGRGRTLPSLDPEAALALARLGMKAVQGAAIAVGAPLVVRSIDGEGDATRIARGPPPDRVAVTACAGRTLVLRGRGSRIRRAAEAARRLLAPFAAAGGAGRGPACLHVLLPEGPEGTDVVSAIRRATAGLSAEVRSDLDWIAAVDGTFATAAAARRLALALERAGWQSLASTPRGRAVLGVFRAGGPLPAGTAQRLTSGEIFHARRAA